VDLGEAASWTRGNDRLGLRLGTRRNQRKNPYAGPSRYRRRAWRTMLREAHWTSILGGVDDDDSRCSRLASINALGALPLKYSADLAAGSDVGGELLRGGYMVATRG